MAALRHRLGDHRGRARPGRGRGDPGHPPGRHGLHEPRRRSRSRTSPRLQEHRHAEMAAQQPGRDDCHGRRGLGRRRGAGRLRALPGARSHGLRATRCCCSSSSRCRSSPRSSRCSSCSPSLGLVDSLTGLAIIYVGASMSVAIWMMAAYMDSIPIEVWRRPRGSTAPRSSARFTADRAAQLAARHPVDGDLHVPRRPGTTTWSPSSSSVPRPSSPCRSASSRSSSRTSPTGAGHGCAVIMMMPPVLVFAFLNRYFSVGGIGGSLAGQ